MTGPQILVAGIGNIFLGDDGFGVEVVRRLADRPLPEVARVVDFGIRGLDLAYALLEGYDAVILVDATQRGDRPGTLYVIEPDLDDQDEPDAPETALATHGMDPVKVFRLVRILGGPLPRVRLVGCEPALLGSEEGTMGLSEPVQAAVNGAMALIEALIADLAGQGGKVQ
jgi:hydrogenase maturation protease